MHGDGPVYPVIPDLIDILKPVQVPARDMDSRRLEAELGADMSFWGGIDTHRVPPTGTPEEGDLGSPINVGAQDEAGRLDQNLDTMRQNLRPALMSARMISNR